MSTTAFTLPAAPSSNLAQGDDWQIVRSSDGRLSLRLPNAWVVIDEMASGNVFVYGSTDAAATGRYNDYNSEPALLVGEGGTITLFALADFDLTVANEDVLTGFMENVLAQLPDFNGELLEAPEFVPMNNGNNAYTAVIQAGNEQGFIATIGFDEYVVLMTATGTPESFAENRETLAAVIASISVPAEAGTTGDTVDNTDTATTLVKAADNSLSIVLPDGWLHEDRLASDGLFAFGDTQAGMQTRVDVSLADDPSTIVISDSGGVIRLLTYEEIGIDPANPNLMPLMGQIAQVYEGSGFDVVETPTEFTANGGYTGLYIVFDSGAQYGYSVLIGFPEIIVFMTATSTSAAFADNQELLFSVVQSVSAPASQQEDDASSGSGLGNAVPGLGTNLNADLPIALSAPDGSLTVYLPTGWVTDIDTEDTRFKVVLGFAADQDSLRVLLASRNPDAPGGFIFLLDGSQMAADTNIDDLFVEIAPEGVDLSKTLSANVNGAEARWIIYTLEEGTANAYQSYFILMSLPTGDWALVVLGAAPELFEDNAAVLEAIFKSITTPESTASQATGGQKD